MSELQQRSPQQEVIAQIRSDKFFMAEPQLLRLRFCLYLRTTYFGIS